MRAPYTHLIIGPSLFESYSYSYYFTRPICFFIKNSEKLICGENILEVVMFFFFYQVTIFFEGTSLSATFNKGVRLIK